MLKYRMNRPTYWFCYSLFMLIVTVLVFIGRPQKGGMEGMMIIIGAPRLHDIGRSGWIIVGVIAAEIVVIFGTMLAGASTDTLEITAGVVFLVIAALGIWLGLIPGDPEANKWGEPPRPGVRFGKPTRQSQSSSS